MVVMLDAKDMHTNHHKLALIFLAFLHFDISDKVVFRFFQHQQIHNPTALFAHSRFCQLLYRGNEVNYKQNLVK